MNKPLSEWTAKEIVEECDRHVCCSSECRCYNSERKKCRLMPRPPACWNLSEPPRWTEDEIEFAKIFQAACKNKIFFERLNDSQILMWGEEGLGSYSNILPYKLLPSLKEGERVTASEIIGGAE